MSGESKQTRSRQWVELPTAPLVVTPSGGAQTFASGGGWIFTLTGGTAVSIDLTTVDWNGPVTGDDPTQSGFGASDAYFSIIVLGTAPVFIAGYPTTAAFNANKPVSSGWTNGLQNTPASQFAVPIFPTPTTGPAQPTDAGRFLARKGVNHILGMISASTPTVFIYRSGSYENSR